MNLNSDSEFSSDEKTKSQNVIIERAHRKNLNRKRRRTDNNIRNLNFQINKNPDGSSGSDDDIGLTCNLKQKIMNWNRADFCKKKALLATGKMTQENVTEEKSVNGNHQLNEDTYGDPCILTDSDEVYNSDDVFNLPEVNNMTNHIDSTRSSSESEDESFNKLPSNILLFNGANTRFEEFSFVFLKIKISNNISDKTCNELLKFIKAILPDKNTCPKNISILEKKITNISDNEVNSICTNCKEIISSKKIYKF